MHSALRFVWEYRKAFIVILTPLLLLPLPITAGTKEASCGYVILLMAVYWITEALPLAVTSLIPIILFPMTGVLKASQVGVLYFKDTNWLMFGGLMIAVAVETSGLHKRIALRVLLIVGVKPRRLMFGFMLVTFFLSMWISNTATTAMMIPIVEAIVKELYEDEFNLADETSQVGESNGHASGGHVNRAYDEGNAAEDDTPGKVLPGSVEKTGIDESFDSIDVEVTASQRKEKSNMADEVTRRAMNIVKGMTICVPYAASIGGTASLTGTVPNLVLSGQYAEIFPDADPNLSFGIWITYCLPQAVVMVLLTYVWLSCWFVGIKDIFTCNRKKQDTTAESRGKSVIRDEYELLGNITWEEITVLVVFIITALLWFFRDPGYMPGWSLIFESGYVSDGTVAVTMAFILFFLPKEKPAFLHRRHVGGRDFKSVEAVLTWTEAQKKFPWNVTLLLGAGFAIAGAATSSGLSAWFGQQLSGLKGIEDWIICLTMTTFICFMTETTSNTATSSLFVPILAELAKTLEVHPLYMLYPPVIAASFAFMLPVATPPNAIAFSYGRITVWDLVKAGWLVNIIGILVLTLSINTFGVAFFNLRQFPDWANSTLDGVGDASSSYGTTSAPCILTTT